MGSNVPLLFLVHCILTTVTLTLMELASSTASPLSIKIVTEIYGVILNEFEIHSFQVLYSVKILYNM